MNIQLRKFFYGDIPEGKEGGATVVQKHEPTIPLWEVFIRSKQGLDHKHAGSLHATDAKMAIENARDVYTRRMEGVSIWVVESKYIHASCPDDAEMLFDPANDKVYRHPTFYDLPDEVKYM
ncbi:MAG: 1,2-phenylacetyl-CoA epoxidase subunit B [Bacteroidetes bacterium]|nr:1,2-phenylacetyl-CoA epoxidase subunit B [Bacteroidota bacterium]